MYLLVLVLSPHQECPKWLLPPLLYVGEPLATQSAALQPFNHYGWAYHQSHPITSLSICGGEGSSFPCSFPPNDMVNSDSVVGNKSSDSGVVIGYQVDEFTFTWSAEHFVA